MSRAQGTAFFVVVENKTGSSTKSLYYLVTNRHMAEPERIDGRSCLTKRFSVRVNSKPTTAGGLGHAVDVTVASDGKWYFPADPSIDLAVMSGGLDPTVYDIDPFPAAFLATSDVIRSQTISEGDTVLFAGFFAQFPGAERIQPIVREGILSMMPDEKLTTTLGAAGRLFLADVHAFGGNSGSPMFVNLNGVRRGNIEGYPYRLLGIVSGYYVEDQDFRLVPSTVLSGTMHANSGISLVVPAEELKNLLDSPDLQTDRARVSQ